MARGSVWLDDLKVATVVKKLNCPASWPGRTSLKMDKKGLFRARLACPRGCTGQVYVDRRVAGEWRHVGHADIGDYAEEYSSEGPGAVVRMRLDSTAKEQFARASAWHVRLVAAIRNGPTATRKTVLR